MPAKAVKKPAAPKPVLVFDQGYWWIVSGTKRLNVGRSKTYANKMLRELGTS